MKLRVVVFIIIFVIIASVLGSCGGSNVLRVYNWGDYMDDSYVRDEFYKETGVRVKFQTYPTNEDMYAKIKSGGAKYDIIIPSDYMINRLISEDMLETIDYTLIPNYKYISSEFKNLEYDSENKFSVPYMWGTLGIIYNKKMVSEKVDSWNILWNSKYKGKIFMMDSVRDSMGVALKKLGYSLNSVNDKQLNEAGEILETQKELVLAYTGDEVKDKMIGNEAALAVVFSGDAVYMMNKNKDLDYILPKEGTNYWFDAVCILKGSDKIELAHQFINLLNRPDVAAKNCEAIGYATPNEEAKKLLGSEVSGNTVAYPDLKLLKNSEVFKHIGANIEKYDKIWQEVKSK